jgi:hypothetical protein
MRCMHTHVGQWKLSTPRWPTLRVENGSQTGAWEVVTVDADLHDLASGVINVSAMLGLCSLSRCPIHIAVTCYPYKEIHVN